MWGQSVILILYMLYKCMSLFVENQTTWTLFPVHLYMKFWKPQKRTRLKGIDSIATDGASAVDTLNQVIPKTSIPCNRILSFDNQQLNYIYGTNFLCSCLNSVMILSFPSLLVLNIYIPSIWSSLANLLGTKTSSCNITFSLSDWLPLWIYR